MHILIHVLCLLLYYIYIYIYIYICVNILIESFHFILFICLFVMLYTREGPAKVGVFFLNKPIHSLIHICSFRNGHSTKTDLPQILNNIHLKVSLSRICC